MRGRIIGVLVLLGLLTAACSSATPSPTPTTPNAASEAATRYSGMLAATEFLEGQARFPFALIDINGVELRNAKVSVRFYSLNQEEPQLRTEHTARWREVTGVTPHEHSDGQLHQHLDVRGIYVVEAVTLDEPGIWSAEFIVTPASGPQPQVQWLAFQVNTDSPAPRVGEPVPATRNPTIHDVERFSDISTRLVEDNMHDYSVAQALEQGKPFVVIFSSPMFCVSRMCGPVTDMAAAIHHRFKETVNFIHIEPWDLDAARNQGQLVAGEPMLEWQLPSEPWLFVVGADGIVAARFEGLVSEDELEQALRQALGTG
jgi:hypothetical protein